MTSPAPGLQPSPDGRGQPQADAAAQASNAGAGVGAGDGGGKKSGGESGHGAIHRLLSAASMRRSAGAASGDKPAESAPAAPPPAAGLLAAAQAPRRVNRRPVLAAPGTVEHALAWAIRSLGMERVAALTGRGASALYGAVDPADPRHAGGLTVEKTLLLAGAVAAAGGPGHLFAIPFLKAAGAVDGGAAPPPCGLFAQAAKLGALYGDTAAALSRLFDAADGAAAAQPLPADLREAAVAAIDREIIGLQAMRSQLLTSTALPALPAAISKGGVQP